MNIMIMVELDEYSGAKTINNAKSAKQEINILKKKAKLKIKNREIQEALDLYKNAIVLATNWELREATMELEDLIRKAEIHGLKDLKKIFEKKALIAEEEVNYEKAILNYNKASEIASEIFKLGITDIKKEIKRFTKKSMELEKDLRTVYKNYK